jgi:4-cresol dehydrogenase (hydroxylating)
MSAIPGVFFEEGRVYTFPKDYVVEDSPDDVFARTGMGIPSLAIFARGGQNGSLGHVFFSPIISATAAEFRRAQAVFSQAYADLGLPRIPIVGGMSAFKRTLILIFPMEISHDPAVNQVTRSNYKKLVRIAADNGWSEYRTAPAFMDTVMETFSFNDHALLKFHETIKDALDPNGILAPGKSGIWPKRLRGQSL